jgi:hypothetical protein
MFVAVSHRRLEQGIIWLNHRAQKMFGKVTHHLQESGHSARPTAR